jgi:uroporphyrin-3 C-methyltransferase
MTEAHSPSHPQPSAEPLKANKRSTGRGWPFLLAIIFFLIALVAAGGVWYQQQRFENLGREVAKQVQGLTTLLNESQRDSKQALGLAQSQAGRIALLEQAQLEAKSQYAALEQIWVGTSQGMENSMLANDIDRLLTTANQQLRLSGNVNNAIMTLEASEALLARADRSRFANLQRAISLDLDRLRAVPLIDIAQLSNKLDGLSALVARAPLLLPDAAAPVVTGSGDAPSSAPPIKAAPAQAAPAQAAPNDPTTTTKAPAAEQVWWKKAFEKTLDWSTSAAALVMREFAEVVSIQRVSDANALLMSPEQGALLRATLRTRVLTAQMALLMKQEAVWKAELGHLQQSLSSRYDPKAVETVAALRLVKELVAIQITAALPDIKASFSALESVRSSEPAPLGGQ